MMETPVGWLWPEGTQVRWWTPAATGLFDLQAPGHPALACTLADLRDQRRAAPLEKALAKPLGEHLAGLLRRFPSLRLCLTQDLADAWHTFPYEWFSLDGAPVLGRLLVARQVPRDAAPARPVYVPTVVALNLWPASEAIQPLDELPPQPGLRIIDSANAAAAEAFLSQTDPATYGVLCVLCHGSEATGAPPFRLPDGRPWRLPTAHGMPPLVLLLACGNDAGNLIDYGRELLAVGARTVLAPLGQPDAAGVRQFLESFLPRWFAGARVDEALLEAQRQSGSERGARRLQLLGRGDLRLSRDPQPPEWPDQRLVAAAADGDSAALVALINRMTLEAFQRDGRLDGAVERLRERLGIPYGAESGERRLLATLDACESALWPLARAWVLPLLLALGEAYDYRLLRKYERALLALDTPLPAAPHVHHYLSKPHYRDGRYGLAARELVAGFALLTPDTLCATGALGLLGQLLNLAIDLNLPAQGRVIDDLLESCLARNASSTAERHRLNRLDRVARLAMRQGRPESAIGRFQEKYHEVKDAGEDGLRELSWLLYATAWLGQPDAKAYADGAKAWLANVEGVSQSVGRGNEDEAYLLRALALWAWRVGDADAARLVGHYRDFMMQRLYVQDPGPFGLAIGFLHLYQKDHPHTALHLPVWETVQGPLATRRYYLELAALGSLLDDAEDTQHWLNRFWTQRLEALPYFEQLPAWLGDGRLAGWSDDVARQTRRETEGLLAGGAPAVETLVRSGLLPL